jgi:hypothetical protein
MADPVTELIIIVVIVVPLALWYFMTAPDRRK